MFRVCFPFDFIFFIENVDGSASGKFLKCANEHFSYDSSGMFPINSANDGPFFKQNNVYLMVVFRNEIFRKGVLFN